MGLSIIRRNEENWAVAFGAYTCILGGLFTPKPHCHSGNTFSQALFVDSWLLFVHTRFIKVNTLKAKFKVAAILFPFY